MEKDPVIDITITVTSLTWSMMRGISTEAAHQELKTWGKPRNQGLYDLMLQIPQTHHPTMQLKLNL